MHQHLTYLYTMLYMLCIYGIYVCKGVVELAFAPSARLPQRQALQAFILRQCSQCPFADSPSLRQYVRPSICKLAKQLFSHQFTNSAIVCPFDSLFGFVYLALR